ncbi:MAG TPA: hypothetical protein PLN48_15990 [Lachnospiraceae bacterium]|nr:hypothetical protein [Lachnospiraceae bacterium]
MAKNNGVVREQENASAMYWKERFEEASGLAGEYICKSSQLEDENQKMADYIHWKGLTDEYLTFRKNAYEEYSPDKPFPRYVM